MIDAIIMDIDGTLADGAHRVHLLPEGEARKSAEAWQAWYDAGAGDKLNGEIAELNNAMADSCQVIIITGRQESHRKLTQDWLTRHGIHWDELLMRESGDHRDDWVVKRELLQRLRANGFNILFAVEDRKQVVKMWREEGVRCLQVCEGDY